MSKPKTWGDIIMIDPSGSAWHNDDGPCFRTKCSHAYIPQLLLRASMRGVSITSQEFGVSEDDIRLIFRYFSLGCPSLDSEIEQPKWQPSEEDVVNLWCRTAGVQGLSQKRECVIQWLDERQKPEKESPVMKPTVTLDIDGVSKTIEIKNCTFSTIPPIPEGAVAIKGFPLLYRDRFGDVRTREEKCSILPWSLGRAVQLKNSGISNRTINDAARYAAEQFRQAINEAIEKIDKEIKSLPEGWKFIEGYPLLCLNKHNEVFTRGPIIPCYPWNVDKRNLLHLNGVSKAAIEEAARYAVDRINKEAGLS